MGQVFDSRSRPATSDGCPLRRPGIQADRKHGAQDPPLQSVFTRQLQEETVLQNRWVKGWVSVRIYKIKY